MVLSWFLGGAERPLPSSWLSSYNSNQKPNRHNWEKKTKHHWQRCSKCGAILPIECQTVIYKGYEVAKPYKNEIRELLPIIVTVFPTGTHRVWGALSLHFLQVPYNRVFFVALKRSRIDKRETLQLQLPFYIYNHCGYRYQLLDALFWSCQIVWTWRDACIQLFSINPINSTTSFCIPSLW